MNLNLVIIVKKNISNTSTKEKQTARQFFAANLAPPNGHEGGGDGGRRERGKRRGKERLNEKEDCEPFFRWEKGPVVDSRLYVGKENDVLYTSVQRKGRKKI